MIEEFLAPSPHPTSGLPDFGNLFARRKSDISDFRWGEGADRVRLNAVGSPGGRQFPYLIIISALLIALDVGCWRAHAQPATTEPLAVVTTTSDLRSLAEAVGGARVSVTNLAPAGLDPEEYQPRPQDLARVARARLIVRVGLDFDLWFDRLLT